MKLWEAVTLWLEFPDLYEMQNQRQMKTKTHISGISTISKRDWVSINRGKVIEFPTQEMK